jgi:hypothetical protein
VPNGGHGLDVPYYFPTFVHALGLLFLTDPSLYSGRSVGFNNPSFISAFASSFVSFAVNLNPNEKVGQPTITPSWSKWTGRGEEMLFNRTGAGAPLVEAFTTDSALRARCR